MTEKQKGFTLVEVIVVLVILAILAAILIPAMTGWIDKAKEKRLIVACRTCVTAAQTLASEAYGKSGAKTPPEANAVIDLAGVTGTASNISIDPASVAVNTLTFSDNKGDSITYYRLDTPHYEVGGGHSLSSAADMEAINTLWKPIINSNNVGQLDSGAAVDANKDKPDIYAARALEALKALGIDLDAMGAKSWTYRKDGGEYGGYMLEWTGYDISKLSAGDKFPIIRYRMDGKGGGMYTVWEATVSERVSGSTTQFTFNAINPSGTQLTNGLTDAQKKDYSTVLAVYEAAVNSGHYAAQ